MAVNNSRNMTDELRQGCVDGSYMHVLPDWGGTGVQPEWERMTWPTYQQVEQHRECAFDSHPLWCGCDHNEVMTSGTPTNYARY